MRHGPVRAALALITVPVLACAASAATFEPLPWRTALAVRSDSTLLYAFAAASPDAAWVLGERTGRRGRTRPVSYHWDGVRWRPSTMPAEPTREHGGVDHGTRLSVSGTRNAWLLLPGMAEYDGEECGLARRPSERQRVISPSRLLRWDGSGWEGSLTVEDAVLTSVVAVGSERVWAFGEDREGPVVLQYDGTGWTRRSSPVRVDDVKALGSEAWVVGESAGARQAGAWRFDGVRWYPVPFGEAHPENKTVTKKKDGRWTGYSSLAVLDDGGIAVSGMVFTGPWCLRESFWSWRESPYQLRWDGDSWTRERGFGQRQLVSQAPDGRGGRYAVGMDFSESSEESEILHRTASGRWTGQGISGWRPIAVFRMPGTASFWAVGEERGRRYKKRLLMRYER